MLNQIGNILWPSNPNGGIVVAFILALIILLNINSIMNIIVKKLRGFSL